MLSKNTFNLASLHKPSVGSELNYASFIAALLDQLFIVVSATVAMFHELIYR